MYKKYPFFDPKKIKKYRNEKGLTQKQLANIAEIPLRTLEDWERGKHIIQSLDAVNRIAISLGVYIDDLCYDNIILARPSKEYFSIWDKLSLKELKVLYENAINILASRDYVKNRKQIYYMCTQIKKYIDKQEQEEFYECSKNSPSSRN